MVSSVIIQRAHKINKIYEHEIIFFLILIISQSVFAYNCSSVNHLFLVVHRSLQSLFQSSRGPESRTCGGMVRKLIVFSFLTLDGVMQAPGGRDEDAEAGFPYGGWQMQFDDDDKTIDDALKNMGALLLGRKTYDIFAAYWPTTGKDIEPFGPIMNSLPKYVASKTLRKTEWQNSQLLDTDIEKAVTQLKKESGKDIWMFGSGNFCQTLMNKNLIDEYLLMIHPVVLGTGKRLFEKGSRKQDLELVKSHITKTGIFVATYKVKK